MAKEFENEIERLNFYIGWLQLGVILIVRSPEGEGVLTSKIQQSILNLIFSYLKSGQGGGV